MFRYLVVSLLTFGLPFSSWAQSMRPMNEVSIVALIITSGSETPVSRSVTHTLESLDAQTLTANAPNASEMRSILKRFTAAALDTDIALVYYDGAVLKIGDREFVAPGGIQLRRSSDLLTKAIPLSALARATALANYGGAVLVHSSAQSIDLISGISLVEVAPAPRTGTSPILFADSDAALSLADGLGAMAGAEGDIDLTEALRGLSSLEGVTISALPSRPAMLRQITVAPPAPETSAPETTSAEEATPEGATAEGLSLPQVVSQAIEASTGEAAEATSTETVVEADPETSTAEAENEAEATQERDAAAAEDSELSIDVLRAMQGALSRSHKRVLQRNLRGLGFYRGLIDGIFGRQSERAISAYQESIGAKVTGVLTPAQLEALSE